MKMLSYFKQSSEQNVVLFVKPGNLEKKNFFYATKTLDALLTYRVYLDIIRFHFRAHVFLWHKGDFTF